MKRFRFLSLLVPMVLSSLVGIRVFAEPDDAKKPAANVPDISGEWLSESPLDSFVQDDSPQPVNSFRIERSKTGDFDIHYLGSRAVAIPVNWDEESKSFKGIANQRGADFVVTTTDDPAILKCEIGKNHKDKWRRVQARRVRVPAGEKAEKRADGADTPVFVYDDDDEAFTDEVKKRTEALMVDFFDFLVNMGFKVQKGQCKIRTQRGMGNAHYYHNIHSIVIDPNYLSDDSVLYREFTHHALAVSLGDDAIEIFQKCSGVESALADYFGCSACEDPFVGRVMAIVGRGGGQPAYLRRMDNQRKFTEVSDSSGRHAVGETLSGAIWEIRNEIGADAVDKLLLKAWMGTVKSDSTHGQVIRFVRSLLEVAGKENEEYQQTMQAIFERRGLTLPPKDGK